MKTKNIVFLLLFSLTIQIGHCSTESEPKIFDGFWKNTKDSFTGENAYFQAGAIALTPIIIKTGADAEVQETFSKQNSDLFVPGAVAGFLAPIAIAGPLYYYGKKDKDNETLRASHAVIQATAITLSYVSILKGITGRPPPKNEKSTSMQDQSEEFNFGISKRGINWGWPSGHMSTTMALVSTLTNYYPEKAWLKWVGYSTAAYMFVTVNAQDSGQMHWFSDAVTGAIIGYTIGSTVGENFRTEQNGGKVSQKTSFLVPIVAPGVSGIKSVWIF